MNLSGMGEADLKETMQAAADAVVRIMPRRTLFVVLAADPGGPGVAQYISNARRPDMIRFLRETADRLERREDDPR